MIIMIHYADLNKEIIKHEELFSGMSRKVGELYWYIQKADTEMNDKCCHRITDKIGIPLSDMLTDFGKEVGPDNMYWWIFRKEKDVNELLKKTETTLGNLQKLKESSTKLRNTYFDTYDGLIRKIKEFCEEQKTHIDYLYNYVLWLNQKDTLAPSILFSDRVWSSSRQTDKDVTINVACIDDDPDLVKICTENALGLTVRKRYVIENIYWDISGSIADSIDPEDLGPISIPEKEFFLRTSSKVLEELADFFKTIRNSLKNIIIIIKQYNSQLELLKNKSFWIKFIQKARRARFENQLWDLKESFNMWHASESSDKERAELKFSEQVAAFANADGGTFLVGIKDKQPRSIMGISDLENKMSFTKRILNKYISRGANIVHFEPLSIKNDEGILKDCLVIVVTQTKDVISVKDAEGKYIYPVRVETGIQRVDPELIKSSKTKIESDNYNFIFNLERYLHE